MRKGTVYHLQLIRTNATIFTSNGTSGSPGDYEVATGPLVSASTHQRVGGAYEVYMLMKRANKSFPQQCVGTLRLRHGDITFQGILLSAAGNISGALAVTGGTGRYRLARGTVTETILGDGTHLAVDIIS
jgi:hypothetical protein